MSDPQKTVFISYRRSLSSYVAQAIFQNLRAKRYDVFMDVASIDSGTFDTIILNQIAARAHFLVICTPGTFDRCAEPDDWLRREIETAIKQQRNIVPVLANGFSFEDSAHYLTGRLADLPRLNGLLLVHDYFDEGMARLRNRFLKQPAAGAVLPTPLSDRAEVAEKIKLAVAQPAPTKEQLSAEDFLYQGLRRSKDDPDGKIADYNESLRLNPEYAQAYNYRGIFRDNKGDLEGAIADYDQAIRFEPNNADAYDNRAFARYRQGDPEGSIADFSEVIRLDPGNTFAYINRGITRAQQAGFAGAIFKQFKIIELDPMNVGIYSDRGSAQERQGNLEGAIADFTEAIRHDPDNSSAYIDRAKIYYQQGDLARAIADCDKAILLHPSGVEAYYHRGKANYMYHNYSEARLDFDVAVRLSHNDIPASAWLAITYHALRRKPEAETRWHKLIDSDPRYLDADWVGKELNWRPELVEAARKLIADLAD